MFRNRKIGISNASVNKKSKGGNAISKASSVHGKPSVPKVPKKKNPKYRNTVKNSEEIKQTIQVIKPKGGKGKKTAK
jgi:hypothetical protein